MPLRSLVPIARLPAALLLACLVSLLAWLPAPGHAAPARPDCAPAVQPLELPADFTSAPAGQFAYVLEDPTGQLGLDDVRQGCHAWQRSSSQGIRPGISSSAWWVRIRIHHPTQQPRKVFLDTQDNLQDHIDIHLLDSQQRVLGSWQTGDRRPFKQRPISSNTVVVPITPPQDGTVDVYMRLASHDGLHEAISPKFYSDEGFIDHTQGRYAVNAIYVGLAASLIVYNAFMYFAARVPMVGLYSLYALTFFLWATTFYGLGFQYVWPDHPDFNNYWLALSACLAHLTGFHFFEKYIGKGAPGTEHIPLKANRLIKLMLLVPTTCALLGQYLLTFVTLMPANLIMATYILSWAGLQWRRGNVMGKYVVLAFSALGAGVILYFMKVIGLVDSNVITDNGIQIGSMLEVLLVAFGVADQLNVIQAGKVAAEKHAHDAQRSLNIELDKLVQERTASLEEANERLRQLSTTDALTRIPNRRSFEDDFRQLLSRRAEQRDSFALSIFDIDHFKWINDQLGHHSGDEVLRTVAQTARRVAEAHGAKVYRFGGEEFAVIFPLGCAIQGAFSAIEEMRQALLALRIPHGGSRFGFVTASFGVVAYQPDAPVAEAGSQHPCAQADKLLYAAKHAGRNTVVQATEPTQREPMGDSRPTLFPQA